MTIRQLVKEMDLQVFSGENGLDREIEGGYVSDLLSDVMGFSQEGEVWVTLQTHKNIMAVASLKDLAAIVLVKGLKPDEDAMDVSNEEGLPILGTDKSCFEFTGKLWSLIK
jgi:predicted transcriptional regulator